MTGSASERHETYGEEEVSKVTFWYQYMIG